MGRAADDDGDGLVAGDRPGTGRLGSHAWHRRRPAALVVGGPDGTDGPPGIFVMDCETFDVIGRWEIDRGPQRLAGPL